MKEFKLHLPDIKKMVSWRSGFILMTLVCLGLFVNNYFATTNRTYTASDGTVDIGTMVTDKLMTYGPLVLSAIAGFIAKYLKIKPEYVQAALDFAKNKDVQEVERRFVSSVVGMVTPLLGKYPELLLSILKCATPYFKDHPKVLEAINALGLALVDAIFKIPVTNTESNDEKLPNIPV